MNIQEVLDLKNIFKRLSDENLMVPSAGLEPARPYWTTDFKSVASTIPPRGLFDLMFQKNLILYKPKKSYVKGISLNKLHLRIIFIKLQCFLHQSRQSNLVQGFYGDQSSVFFWEITV